MKQGHSKQTRRATVGGIVLRSIILAISVAGLVLGVLTQSILLIVIFSVGVIVQSLVILKFAGHVERK